jgi:hypothetical protein
MTLHELSDYKMNHRETHHRETGKDEFTKDFRHIALQFYQDPNALVSQIKVPQNDHPEYRKTHGIHHDDRIYLIGKKGILTCGAIM